VFDWKSKLNFPGHVCVFFLKSFSFSFPLFPAVFVPKMTESSEYAEFMAWKMRNETPRRENLPLVLEKFDDEDEVVESSRRVVVKDVSMFSFIDELKSAKWRLLVAICFLIGLSVMFALVGTLVGRTSVCFVLFFYRFFSPPPFRRRFGRHASLGKGGSASTH
jgi:hypothetical protein